jgi:DNA-binding SARP family transcriptional activator
VGVVEAGAGYGKSVLASAYRQALGVATAFVPLGPPDGDAAVLSSSLRRALLAAKLSDLASTTDVDEPAARIDRLLDALVDTDAPLLLILDDAHHLGGSEAAALVLRLAHGLPEPHRLLVTARRLPLDLEPLRSIEGCIRLGTADLAFSEAELADLVRLRLGSAPSAHDVRLLLESTRGWATAAVLATTSMARVADAGRTRGVGGDPIAPMLSALLVSLQPADLEVLVQLAHLPVVSPEVADAVAEALRGDGDGAHSPGDAGTAPHTSNGAPNRSTFDRLVTAGIPLTRAETGWWEMPGPVTTRLAARRGLRQQAALAAARVYEATGGIIEAIRVLLQAGLPTDAAAMMAAVPPARLDDIDWALMRDIVESLPEPSVRTHPRVLLHLSRAAEAAHRADVRSAALERAFRLVEGAVGEHPGADTSLLRELQAEQARDLMWDERRRLEARRLATEVIERAGGDEHVARARALDVLGRLSSWFSAEGPQPAAESLLEESARLSRRVGQPTWAAQALVALAMGYHFALCRYERALATLDDALRELPATSRYRALVLSFRADLLAEVGKLAEAEGDVDEMREIGRRCRDEWILAFACWSQAVVASYSGDGSKTLAAVREADRHRDVWYEQASGVEFLASAADLLDRAGEHGVALEYLQRARDRMAGCERPVKVFGAAVLARSGDPVEAEQVIATALAGIDLEPQERWPLLLLRAEAARRRGDAAAPALAATAFDFCAELGHPRGPLIRERAVAESLLPLAVAAGSRVAISLSEGVESVELRLLGGFELRRGGRLVELPPGRPAKAVRAVAAVGGRMHIEQLLEILWPGADPDTGRNRLRNLLSRLRLASGAVLVRDQELVTLVRGAAVDSWQFEAQARSVLSLAPTPGGRGESGRGSASARSALGRYHGDLLPDDRHEEWAVEVRERLRARYLELLDLVAEEAEASGDVDEAARLITRAIEAEPYDEQRYLQLARLLASQGRTGSARSTTERARTAMAELGLPISPAMTALKRALGEDRGWASRP